jgi:hypothetical protein
MIFSISQIPTPPMVMKTLGYKSLVNHLFVLDNWLHRAHAWKERKVDGTSWSFSKLYIGMKNKEDGENFCLLKWI